MRADVSELVRRLLELHKRGTLHVMDRGEVCVGCGGQWPCRTVQLVHGYAVEVMEG